MHWTYQAAKAGVHLQQGDILAVTPDLQHVLGEAHAYFNNSKYMGFIVTTQSCDLVPRTAKGVPKASYVNIAAIRSLNEVAGKLVHAAAEPIGARFCRGSSKPQARRFLERLFNQNEQGQGLFYLHRCADIGFYDPCVAFLRVSIALKAEHYEVLLRSRIGTLNDEFRAKLGWLVGNLYSRAATRDWQDEPDDEREFEALVAKYLASDNVVWVDDSVVDACRRKGVEIALLGEDWEIELERYRPPDPIDKLNEAVAKQLERLMNDHVPLWKELDEVLTGYGTSKGADDDAKDEVLAAIKDRVRQHMNKLINRLQNDAVVRQVVSRR